jgi:FAD:protein FMN transferase
MFRFGFEAMGCGCEVVVAATGKAEAVSAAEAAIREVSRIENKYSRYHKGSVVPRINALAGAESCECDDETMGLLLHASLLHAQSGGLFDITTGVLRRAWNLKSAELPSPEAVHELLKLVGWEKVELDRHGIRLPVKGMEIDLGGIGKEYAVDRAARLLFSAGVRHGYVNLGGDIMVVGPMPDGKPWTIGVRDPENAEKLFASVPIHGGGLATSGDYGLFFEKDGQRYGHILNPRTGYPVDHWRSVTVIAPSALQAGSISTVAMLRVDDALDYLEASGMNYLAVDRDGALYQKQ